MAYYFMNTMTDTNQLNWQRTNLENIETAWEGDLWDRKRLGIQLTNYVDRLQCGAVLALDARWGEGKTWFVRHWQKHLEKNNFPLNFQIGRLGRRRLSVLIYGIKVHFIHIDARNILIIFHINARKK